MSEWSRDAFNCYRCPKEGCPMWWKTMWTDLNGRQELKEGCGYQQLPLYLVEVIKASNRPAAAIESTRNEIVRGFQRLSEVQLLHLEARENGQLTLPELPLPID